MTGSEVKAPRIVVYCDESRHDLTAHHRFMAIGGLRVPCTERTERSREFRHLRDKVGAAGEVKWRKVSEKKLDAYKKLIDFFFRITHLSFRVIVVDQTRVDLRRYHGRDRELAFYKFYYEMLEKWLEAGKEYVILLDFKKNRGADRHTTLRRYLENYLRGKAWITELTVIDSRQTPLAQLCDLLTGAVAGAYNGPRPRSPKEELTKYIASRLGADSLCKPTALSERKFNIFCIDLD